MVGVSVLTLLASAGRVIGAVKKKQQQEQHNEPDLSTSSWRVLAMK